MYIRRFFVGNFEETLDGKGRIKPVWQWNHEPDAALWEQTKRGGYRITTGKSV